MDLIIGVILPNLKIPRDMHHSKKLLIGLGMLYGKAHKLIEGDLFKKEYMHYCWNASLTLKAKSS